MLIQTKMQALEKGLNPLVDLSNNSGPAVFVKLLQDGIYVKNGDQYADESSKKINKQTLPRKEYGQDKCNNRYYAQR
jgi:hypothetical protein